MKTAISFFVGVLLSLMIYPIIKDVPIELFRLAATGLFCIWIISIISDLLDDTRP